MNGYACILHHKCVVLGVWMEDTRAWRWISSLSMSLRILLSSGLLPLPYWDWFWIRLAEKSDVEEGCEGLCSRPEPGIRYINRGNRGGKDVRNDMILGTLGASKNEPTGL